MEAFRQQERAAPPGAHDVREVPLCRAGASARACKHRYQRVRTARTLMRMPSCAPTPVPTMTAVGVARPSAQGQEITTTLMPNSEAKRPNPWPCGSHAAGYRPDTPAQYLHQRRGFLDLDNQLAQQVTLILDLTIGGAAEAAAEPSANIREARSGSASSTL